MIPDWQRGGFGIYVHWPFCAAKCPYCDFNSHVAERVDQDRFLQAFLSEIEHWAERTGRRRVSSVFFGGGTPSLMEPRVTGAILEAIAARWTAANDLEVTLEANPTSVEASRFENFAVAGVNRFSIGLQSLDDQALRRLGRLHSAAEGRRAVDVARSVSDRVSFDLIYARQDQTAEAWELELSEAVAMGPDHLSLYQLTIEEGTAFWNRAQAGGLRGLPNEDLAVALWEVTQAVTAAAGLRRYEVSNHARPGQESRHNLIYWRGGDWLGLGPGAHGRVDLDGRRHATVNVRSPGGWLAAIEARGVGLESDDALSTEDIADEAILMGLRLSEGLPADELLARGASPDLGVVAELVRDGLVEPDTARLRVTERGVLLTNQVVARLRGL